MGFRVVGFGLLAFVATGCGKHQAPKAAATSVASGYLPVPQDATCSADGQAALTAVQANDFAKAQTTAADAYARCGFGYGLLTMQSLVAAHEGNFDGAAELLLREMSEPFPSTEAIHFLAALRPKMSPAQLAKVTTFGNTAEAPVVVPDIPGEYKWIALVVCGDATVRPRQQALLQLPTGRSVDALYFSCAGEAETVRYFDYSADPNERLFMQQILEHR